MECWKQPHHFSADCSLNLFYFTRKASAPLFLTSYLNTKSSSTFQTPFTRFCFTTKKSAGDSFLKKRTELTLAKVANLQQIAKIFWQILGPQFESVFSAQVWPTYNVTVRCYSTSGPILAHAQKTFLADSQRWRVAALIVWTWRYIGQTLGKYPNVHWAGSFILPSGQVSVHPAKSAFVCFWSEIRDWFKTYK